VKIISYLYKVIRVEANN